MSYHPLSLSSLPPPPGTEASVSQQWSQPLPTDLSAMTSASDVTVTESHDTWQGLGPPLLRPTAPTEEVHVNTYSMCETRSKAQVASGGP